MLAPEPLTERTLTVMQDRAPILFCQCVRLFGRQLAGRIVMRSGARGWRDRKRTC